MAKILDQPKRPSKRERRRAVAEARALARRRTALRRRIGYALGALAAIAVVVLGALSLLSDTDRGGEASIGPAPPGEVTVSARARTEPIGQGEVLPPFSAPGFRVVSDPVTKEPAIRRERVEWSAGAPTVVSVWAPWCAHCQAELPILDRVMGDYLEVAFLTVVTSIGTSPGPDAGAFLADNGIAAPTAIDDAEGTLARSFGIRGFPTLYFVGSDGVVSMMTEGEVGEDDLRALIDQLS